MKNTTGKLCQNLRRLSRLLFLCFTANTYFISSGVAQSNKWVEHMLYDNPYTSFCSTDFEKGISNGNYGKYPVTNLFDGTLHTCWVAGNSQTALLYVKIPDAVNLNKLILNIFSGYGKSQSLFLANARPKKVKVTVLAAFVPDGYVSENAMACLMSQYPKGINLELADTFAVQSFLLKFNTDSLDRFFDVSLHSLKSFSGGKIISNLPENFIENVQKFIVLKVEILEVYAGTKYSDVCISELFFNDRFVTAKGSEAENLKDISIENDSILKANYADGSRKTILSGKNSTFTNVEISSDKKWAILYYVPNEAVGEGSRVEELHSLIDLTTFRVIDAEFEKETGVSPTFLNFSDDSEKVKVTDFVSEVELL